MANGTIKVYISNCKRYHVEFVKAEDIYGVANPLGFVCDQFKPKNGTEGDNRTSADLVEALKLNETCRAHCGNNACERLRV